MTAGPAGPVVIVTGMPGSGKSTVTRGLAAALPRAARVAADDLNGMILSGAVWPLGEPSDEAARQVDLCYRNIGSLVENFAAAGFCSIVDCVVPDEAHLDRLVRHLPERPTVLIVLGPGEAVCRARDAERPADEQFAFDGYAELDASMRRGFGDRGWWVDTADLSGGQTVQLILDGPADPDGALVGADPS